MRREELANAVQAVRGPDDTDATIAQRLETIFAAEAERVATAAVTAELLGALLARPGAAEGSAVPFKPGVSSPRPPAAPIAAPPPRGDPADIAHFIDEMLAQERTAPRGARQAS